MEQQAAEPWRLEAQEACQGDLEYAWSPVEEQRRCASEGGDAGLTELAAPRPAPEEETGDDLEDEEAQEEEANRRDSTASYENGLTEVALPEPVGRQSPSPDTSNEEQKAGVEEEKASEASQLLLDSGIVRTPGNHVLETLHFIEGLTMIRDLVASC